MFALILIAQLHTPFFERTEVNFWGTKPRPLTIHPPLWLEPGHTPPAPVIRLLEEPSPEHARAYIEWQEDRLARLQKALALIEEVKRPVPEAHADRDDILYFTQENCPFCTTQDVELASAKLGGRSVQRLTPKDAPELWRRYNVTATPTLVVAGQILRGFHTRDQIEQTLR